MFNKVSFILYNFFILALCCYWVVNKKKIISRELLAFKNLQCNKIKSELIEVLAVQVVNIKVDLTAVDSGLLLTGEVEKWTLIPSHYKLLSSFVTVTIFQGESLRPDSQTKTHLFLTSRTQRQQH